MRDSPRHHLTARPEGPRCPRPLPDHVDVLIIGAGLSGIGAGWRLRERCPGKRLALVEARAAMGGTWDLFRYPGIRSDSDKYTFGYPFRPWSGPEPFAEGAEIRRYIHETAREAGLMEDLYLQHRVVRASWSSARARWTVDLEVGETRTPRRITCGLLYACTGYYAYDHGYTPDFPGLDSFSGPVVHPQSWPEDLDLAGRAVVVIGSGATAVTLVPALADQGARVTMLQRSPTWVLDRPRRSRFAAALQTALPPALAHAALRAAFILESWGWFQISRRAPGFVGRLLHGRARRALDGAVPLDPHFSPSYDPWDQRLCVAPDGDLFRVLREGTAHIVTDHIARVLPEGLALRSGRTLPADVLITATGLRARLLHRIDIVADGTPVDFSETLAYKGMMYSGVPNFAYAFGYTNASWTLKCDLIARRVCALLQHMDRHGLEVVVPEPEAPPARTSPLVDLSSGYVRRVADRMPRQGDRAPWRVHQSYLSDLWALGAAPVDGPGLRFGRAATDALNSPEGV